MTYWIVVFAICQTIINVRHAPIEMSLTDIFKSAAVTILFGNLFVSVLLVMFESSLDIWK